MAQCKSSDSAVGHCQHRWLRALSVAAILLGGLLDTPAATALDLKEIGADLAVTPAQIERLKTWEIGRIYGARSAREQSDPYGHPEYIRVGNFFLINQVDNQLRYDSNVHAVATGATPDLLWHTEPLLVLRSDFRRHILDFRLGGGIVRHAREQHLDHEDINGQFTAIVHIDHAHIASVKVGAKLTHEDRLATGAATNATSLTPIVHRYAAVGLRRDAGRLHASTGVSYDDRRYTDVTDASGAAIPQGHRDLSQAAVDLKLGYRFSPGFELLGRLKGLRQHNAGDVRVDTTAWGIEAVAGVRFELGALLRLALDGGYGIRDYDRPGVDTAGIGLIEGRLDWLISPSLTAVLTANRSFDDGVTSSTVLGGSGGRVQQIVSGRLDYWLARNLMFTLGADYRQTVFQDESRTDEQHRARASLERHLGPHLRLTFGVEHINQKSTVPEFDIQKNVISAGVRYRF